MIAHWDGLLLGVLIGMALMTCVWLAATWPRG